MASNRKREANEKRKAAAEAARAVGEIRRMADWNYNAWLTLSPHALYEYYSYYQQKIAEMENRETQGLTWPVLVQRGYVELARARAMRNAAVRAWNALGYPVG